MLDVEITTSKCSDKVNLSFVDQIISRSLKVFMWLLINDKDDITWLDAWGLITFTSKDNSLAIFHTRVDVNLQDLTLRCSLVTVTSGTTILWINDITGTVTLITLSLESLNHWAHLSCDEFETTTTTSGTLLNSSFLTTTSFTGLTQHCLVQSQLSSTSLVQLFQSSTDWMLHIGTFLWTPWSATGTAKHTTATKEL